MNQSTKPDVNDQGARFHENQLQRAIQVGSIAILRDEIRESLLDAYVAMGAANHIVDAAWKHPKGSTAWAEGVNEATRRIRESQPKIVAAKHELLKFLASEPPIA